MQPPSFSVILTGLFQTTYFGGITYIFVGKSSGICPNFMITFQGSASVSTVTHPKDIRMLKMRVESFLGIIVYMVCNTTSLHVS